MSLLLYQYFLRKTNLDSVVRVGGADDPYFETVPEQDLHFYQRKGAKRKRKLPGFIADHDLKVLNKVKKRAYRLDLQLSMCGFRFGWAGLIGIIPWIGDIIAAYWAYLLVRKAEQIEGGLPVVLRLKMMANVAFDFGIGLIPIVGDIINMAYKCNLRNFVMLEQYLVEKYQKKQAQDPGKLGQRGYRDEVSPSQENALDGKNTKGAGYGDPIKAV